MENSKNNKTSYTQGIKPENTFKILIATDIHLGYDESNSETGDDSFNTFEEILMLANSRDVDFILLAGDLFHKAQPSSTSMNKCIQLLRTYAMGRKQIEFDITDMTLGEEFEPKDNNSNSNRSMLATTAPLNYEDENINISYPVFTIHGNHDDIVNNLSAIDILSSSGLVNYFGKWENLNSIDLKPIIFRKGLTSIALYGLSHIPDRRLYNLFQNDKVHAHFAGDVKDLNKNFFNILAIHQNRAERSRANYILPEMLPSFMNFVVWGHEHDCRIDPEQYNNMYITQPGSSVATSLCEGEAIEKKVGILQVCYNPTIELDEKYQFILNAVKLKTVRPFIFRSIDIDDYKEEFDVRDRKISDQVEKVLTKTVLEMMKEAKTLYTKHPRQPKKPLLRLRVCFDNVDYLINTRRFGQRFSEYVAKCEELLTFKKNIHRLKVEKPEIDEKLLEQIHSDNQMEKVEDYINDYFSKLTEENEKLAFFDFKCLTEVVRLLAEKEDQQGAENVIQTQYDAAVNYVKTNLIHTEDLSGLIWSFRDQKSNEIHENIVVNKKTSPKKEERESISIPSTSSAILNKPKVSQIKFSDDEDSEKDIQSIVKSNKRPQKVNSLNYSSSSDIDLDNTNVRQTKKKQAQPTAAKRGRGSRGGSTTASSSVISSRSKGRASATTKRGQSTKVANQELSIAQQLSQRRSQRGKQIGAITSTQKDSLAFIISSDENSD